MPTKVRPTEVIHAEAVKDPTLTYETRELALVCGHPLESCSFFQLAENLILPSRRPELVYCGQCGSLWTAVQREWSLPAFISSAIASTK